MRTDCASSAVIQEVFMERAIVVNIFRFLILDDAESTLDSLRSLSALHLLDVFFVLIRKLSTKFSFIHSQEILQPIPGTPVGTKNMLLIRQ